MSEGGIGPLYLEVRTAATYLEALPCFHLISVFADPEASEGSARAWRDINDARRRTGLLSWDGVLCGIMCEATSTTDPTIQREKLIELAAAALVAVTRNDSR